MLLSYSKRTLLAAALVFSGVFIFAAAPAHAQVVTNLILNPSLETASGSVPANWTSDYWGTPAPTFTYPAAGHTGNGATITFAANSTGDARFQPDAVALEAGATYTYSIWYNSTVATEIDAELTNSSGAISYAWLADVPSSLGVWKQLTTTFATPAGITKASFFQLIWLKGTLTIDDVSLTKNGTTPPPPPPPTPTLTFSASPLNVQQGSASTLTWSSTNATACTASNGWTGTKAVSGTQSVTPSATSTYALLCTGAGGTVSQQVTVSVTLPVVPPPPPTSPTLTFTASPATITKGANSTLTWSATNVTSCTASNGWTGTKAISGTKVVTPTATTTYALACTGAGGNVSKQVVVGVTVPPPPPPPGAFTEGMVTLSFDDAWASQYTNALPILQSSGLPATFYMISEVIQGSWQDYMTPLMAQTIAANGYEIADHTITHTDLTTISQSKVTNEITASRTYLQNLTGKTITSMAYPYGSVNNTVKNLVKQAGYTSARGVDDSQLNTAKSDKFNLFGSCVLKSTPFSEIKAAIDAAKANKQWYILCFHEIRDLNDDYSMTAAQLQQIVDYIKSTGIKTVTVSQGRALMAN